MANSINDDYIQDAWPKLPDGTDYDGHNLLALTRAGQNPFKQDWDINQLIQEVEAILGGKIIDIPHLSDGSNNYGFHIKLSNHRQVVARLSKGDVNMPHFDGWPFDKQVSDIKFEAAVYNLLAAESAVRTSKLLYSREPIRHQRLRLQKPTDVLGRRLQLFERSEGRNDMWKQLDRDTKLSLLTQAASMRAALFNFTPSPVFAQDWLLQRLPDFKPSTLEHAVESTREFTHHLLASKINATIGSLGNMIGWPSDNSAVGPRAYAAKASLLRLLPYVLPPGDQGKALYRLVLEHGDFGIHNMTIVYLTIDSDSLEGKSAPYENEKVEITSLFDFETGHIVPAILADPLMSIAGCDLGVNGAGESAISRLLGSETEEVKAELMGYATHYITELNNSAPGFEKAVRAGEDVRRLWFALRDWRGDDAEEFFGSLGEWAERRIKEIDTAEARQQ